MTPKSIQACVLVTGRLEDVVRGANRCQLPDAADANRELPFLSQQRIMGGALRLDSESALDLPLK